MEQLTWTGGLGVVLDPIFLTLIGLLLVALAAQIVLAYVAPSGRVQVNPDGTIAAGTGPHAMSVRASVYLLLGVVAAILVYIVMGALRCCVSSS